MAFEYDLRLNLKQQLVKRSQKCVIIFNAYQALYSSFRVIFFLFGHATFYLNFGPKNEPPCNVPSLFDFGSQRPRTKGITSSFMLMCVSGNGCVLITTDKTNIYSLVS